MSSRFASQPVAGLLLLAVLLVYHLGLAGRPLFDPLGLALARGLGWSLIFASLDELRAWAWVALLLALLYEFTASHARTNSGGDSVRGAIFVALLGFVAALLGVLALSLVIQPLELRSMRSAFLAIGLLAWTAVVLPPLLRAWTRADVEGVREAVERLTESHSLLALSLCAAAGKGVAFAVVLAVILTQWMLRTGPRRLWRRPS